MAKCETCKFDNVCDFSGTFRNNVRECRTYEQKEPQTWGNKIRAMSDEELAEFLECVETAGYHDESITPMKNGFRMDMLEWLKSEVKE